MQLGTHVLAEEAIPSRYMRTGGSKARHPKQTKTHHKVEPRRNDRRTEREKTEAITVDRKGPKLQRRTGKSNK